MHKEGSINKQEDNYTVKKKPQSFEFPVIETDEDNIKRQPKKKDIQLFVKNGDACGPPLQVELKRLARAMLHTRKRSSNITQSK